MATSEDTKTADLEVVSLVEHEHSAGGSGLQYDKSKELEQPEVPAGSATCADFGLEIDEGKSEDIANQEPYSVSATSSSAIEALYESTTPALVSTATSQEIFTLFPKLPIELRLKIWKQGLPGPRIIEIFHPDIPYFQRGTDDYESEESPLDEQDPAWQEVHLLSAIKDKLPPPVLLSVNHESRQVALKKYSLRLDTVTKAGNFWIDPVQDILFLPYDSIAIEQKEYILFSSLGLTEEVLSKIVHLAVDIDMLDLVLPNLFLLTSIQLLTVVLHDGCNDNWDQEESAIVFFDANKRMVEYYKQYSDVQDLIEKARGENARLTPILLFRCMARGGIKCSCYEEYP